MLLNIPLAHADPFTLGAFDFYGLLIDNGVPGGDINTPPVNANIGIGNVGGPINLHNEVVNGEVDCAGSCASAVAGGNITGTQPVSLGGAAPSGSPASVNSNVARVEAAITAATNLSSVYGAEASLGTAVTLTGSTTINASSGHLDSSGAEVFTATTFSPGNSHTITVNGTASQFVVIDVTGGGNSLNGALTLTGGITADQVLINFTGSGGNLQGAGNGATLEGTFLAPGLSPVLSSDVIDGHLFGGGTGNFQFVSNTFINQPPITPPTTGVPEPASMALFGTGLLGLFGLLRRRA